MDKKGLAFNDLFQFVLLVVMVAIVIGAGVLALDKFGGVAATSSAAASTAINNARTEVGNISTNWLGIIITIAMVAILIGLLVTSFSLRR